MIGVLATDDNSVHGNEKLRSEWVFEAPETGNGTGRLNHAGWRFTFL